ncbi:MarR family transcriptional regulator [Paraburkholderia sp. Ac-20336]|uniref:MarR family winged helix-turn-helix transcriptional regulator n=1 Tax=Burkholderiaceae TaxID=119060 RepID=UPI0014245600|nr:MULTISPECIES: MarR family transcriptional regulator [Burkholderiaceae]MBN3804034.1 MarR family transcriptional regulator [Paraburkholderia sp. Ac-20336]MBN3847647.1 MarR family transcriptional regulator [Paraburkholderia sp. Ac-20342]NIF53390.1 MarR family transcriptional regulator [Burkholderia sp. Ax-1724]NIF78689.1 MarR family transcriptional regulator [Paraburkholderia sp. Cy-641]
MYSDFLTFRLDLTSALLTNRANVVYRERWNLDVRALRVLRLVCAEPDITPTAVSQRALIEKTLLSKVLTELETRGFITRNAHSSDRRSIALRATPDGLKVAKASEALGLAMEAQLATVLSDSERKLLEQLLSKLSNSLLARESVSTPPH